jgi:hypothetical protein
LPKAISIKLKPIDEISVEGPMFIEGLTEALNQLGVLQKGLLSAVVDPSLPEIHQFYIEELEPDSICLADGELRVELLRAVNRPDGSFDGVVLIAIEVDYVTGFYDESRLLVGDFISVYFTDGVLLASQSGGGSTKSLHKEFVFSFHKF